MTTTADAGKLEITTPSEREIAITRAFSAPRERVFDAYTRPELLVRWLGAFRDWTFAVCEVDLRVGGSYRFVWRGAGGKEMGMGGVYREIVRPERLVVTEKFDQPWYPGGAVVTTTFAAAPGRTVLTSVILYDSREIRDGVLASPMEVGLTASYDQLSAILAEPAR